MLAFFPVDGFLGTSAPFQADLNLVVQLAMGIALIVGSLLAKRKHYRVHGICQTSVMLLNLVMIGLVMWPGFYLSPDLKYLYFRTVGKQAKVARLRLSDRTIETITRMDNVHLAEDADISVTPDDSVLSTRDVGVQEIYSLTMKWP